MTLAQMAAAHPEVFGQAAMLDATPFDVRWPRLCPPGEKVQPEQRDDGDDVLVELDEAGRKFGVMLG